MQRGSASAIFLIFVAGAAAFVLFSSRMLPEVVASHFGASGAANGFMPRAFYIAFMLAFVIGLPVLLVFVTSFAIGSQSARINLPNRDYWLAPERRAQTIRVLRAGIIWFGALLVTFLCYAHWLVVLANEAQPARLAESWFLGGLAAFLLATLIWLKVFVVRFRNLP
jgi:uncharacterized membrane protein